MLAGGTDFFPALQEAQAPAQVLDIKRIENLRRIQQTDDGWTIGAACTWTDIIRQPLPKAFDGLKAAAREVGSVQIQNTATLVGNLCNASPAADGVPPLLALDAQVELAALRGRRCLSLSEFILGPRKTAREADELVVAIHIPAQSDRVRSGFCKHGSRRYLVISIVMLSLVLEVDDNEHLQTVRIAVGACSAVACRLHRLEQALTGQSIHADLQSMVTPGHLSELSPIDDIRSDGSYRLVAAHQILRRMLSATLSELPNQARAVSPAGHIE